MNKMIGLILVIFGLVCFIGGLIIFSSSGKSQITNNAQNEAIENNFKVKYPDNSVKRIQPENTQASVSSKKINTNISKALSDAIDVAIADGILTINEKKSIQKIADRQGVDYKKALKEAEKKLKESEHDSETELVDINKRKGDDFEKYVVKKFSRKYFKIKEWAGDKYIEGIYAETTSQPDLLVEFRYKDVSELFSVECKWRSGLFKKGIEIANPMQFKRYKKYEKEQEIPVFIAFGLGGTAKDPERLYIIPLRDLSSNFIGLEMLKKFKKTDNRGLYYDRDKMLLR